MKRLLIFLASLVAVVVALGAVWRRAAERWNVPCASWLSWFLHVPYIPSIWGSAAILEHAGIQPGMRVLDVGTGPGRVAIPAARRVGPEGDVVAFDIQPGMLRQLEERMAQQGVRNIQPRRGNIGEQSVEPDTFDRVLLNTVLGEIVHREAALRTIYGALKPGGILSVTEVLPDPHYLRASTVTALAQAAGFRVQQRWGNAIAFTVNLEKPAHDAESASPELNTRRPNTISGAGA
ncbi:MAG TPA: methyltransferase domain-containing protein [Thermomicrobiaceae bacterium]|nr:methyltransferase domain-containing protein [Thermomicrobiaceae bacterium]